MSENGSLFSNFFDSADKPTVKADLWKVGFDSFIDTVTHPVDTLLHPGANVKRILEKDLPDMYVMPPSTLNKLIVGGVNAQKSFRENPTLLNEYQTMRRLNPSIKNMIDDFFQLQTELEMYNGDLKKVYHAYPTFVRYLSEKYGDKKVKFNPSQNAYLDMILNHYSDVYNSFLDTLNLKSTVIEEAYKGIRSPISDVVGSITGVNLNDSNPGDSLQNPVNWIKAVLKQLFGFDLDAGSILVYVGVALLVLMLISKVFNKLL